MRSGNENKEKWKRNENFSQDFKVTLHHRLQHIVKQYTVTGQPIQDHICKLDLNNYSNMPSNIQRYLPV